MKTNSLLLFLFVCLIPHILFSQFIQQGPKLIGTGAVGNSYQGTSVAISWDGNTAIEGGERDNPSGAIWVFIRNAGAWTQQGEKLVGTGAGALSDQGISSAISSDGNTIVVGSAWDNVGVGAIWIFSRSGNVWTQQGQKIVGSGAIGSAFQGTSVAISADGNTVIVGGYQDNNLYGAAWVFIRNGTIWTQQGPKLVGQDAIGNIIYQGMSVAISSDGNTALIGGPQDNDTAGATWTFTRTGNIWTHQGSKLVGTGSIGKSYQGSSVSISADGNTAITGGPHDNNQTGAFWVFKQTGGVWSQQGPKLWGNDGVGQSLQGNSVVISSDWNTAIVGGLLDNNGTGALWVFTQSNNIWSQLGSKHVGSGAIGISYQGSSVAISSEGTFVEGGIVDNNQKGAIWIFHNPTIGITPISNDIPKSFSLSQNYPNPFNPTSKIRFSLPNPSEGGANITKLVIYDILGREIATLVNQQLQPRTYEVSFDGTNLPSGVYFYRLESGSFVETKKMSLVK